MIDTNKLIPKRKEGGRSIKTIGNIELIKKDVVKIDNLLKEKLILSKVRYGILRNQNQKDKRIKREGVLESKKSRPQDYDANLKRPVKSGTNPRRVSFAARFSGMKGPMKDEKGRPTRKALALKAWGFGSVEAARNFANRHKKS